MKDGGPAFSVADLSKTQCPGMSLRDYFAAAAMSSMLTPDTRGAHDGFNQAVVESAYKIADAMLAHRDRPGESEVKR